MVAVQGSQASREGSTFRRRGVEGPSEHGWPGVVRVQDYDVVRERFGRHTVARILPQATRSQGSDSRSGGLPGVCITIRECLQAANPSASPADGLDNARTDEFSPSLRPG